MAYDIQVAKTAYFTAIRMGASDKVLLALFEAGIVESGFRNLGHQGERNDHDSLGFLQQRPSQGWPSPMDVPTATRSFVSRAIEIEHKYATAGQLAQAVQRSAFPLRYDAVKVEATRLLNQVSNNRAGDGAQAETPTRFEALETMIETITDKSTWIRIGLWVVGSLLMLIALIKLTGDNKLSDTTKSAIKVATNVASRVK